MEGEFKVFKLFLDKEGITTRQSCLYLHDQNGKVERKHKHVVKTGLTLLAQVKCHCQEAFTYIYYQQISLICD